MLSNLKMCNSELIYNRKVILETNTVVRYCYENVFFMLLQEQ